MRRLLLLTLVALAAAEPVRAVDHHELGTTAEGFAEVGEHRGVVSREHAAHVGTDPGRTTGEQVSGDTEASVGRGDAGADGESEGP